MSPISGIMVVPKHMPALDGLRAIAILLVILVHVSEGWGSALSIYPGETPLGRGFVLPLPAELIAGRAGIGVQLFFIVSAFTLTCRLAQDRGGSLVAYAVRRLARVGPGYWLAAIGYTLWAGTGARPVAPNGIAPVDMIVAAIFGSAWQQGASLMVVPGGWSVSCEVTFYIALPLLLWLIDGRVWRAAVLTALAIIAAQLRHRHVSADYGVSWVAAVSPFANLPIFLCGITAATIVAARPIPNWRFAPALALIGAIVILPLLRLPAWYFQHQLAFALVATIAVPFAALYPPRLLASAAARRIGEVSYSMYLIHFAILLPSLRLALWIWPGADWVTAALHMGITTSVTFGLACLSYRYIERPAISRAARYGRAPATNGFSTA